VLDRKHLVAMLRDDEFYRACPYFLWLKTTAKQTLEVYDKAKSDCAACAGDFKILQPVVDAFFANLKELKELDPDNVICVKRYLETRKNKTFGRVVIYYRATKQQPAPLKFEF